MKEIRFFIDIPAHRYLAFYQGAADQVVTTAVDGRRVRFPAHILRPFVTHDGIRGEFALRYDECNRFAGIRKLR